jgi:hypothetical protein
MKKIHRGGLMLTLASLSLLIAPLTAAEPNKKGTRGEPAPPPKPADVQSLSVHPADVALKGGDSSQQLVVTAALKDGRTWDLTGEARYEAVDKVVRITSAGRVLPLTSGATSVQISYGPHHATVAVKAEAIEQNLPINFANQVVPVFTKLGCNSGGCHGKASGQNGFHLSLLGFEPDVDYAALTMEARGRRVSPSAADNSLLLQKATGQVAHGGGKRMEIGSDEYKLLRRWIAGGTALGDKSDPTITRISIFPESRILARNSRQQLAVFAHYDDGHTEDVTRLAQYESNDPEVAAVDGAGLVETLSLSGQSAVMARYAAQVCVFRAVVPFEGKLPAYQFTYQTAVDRPAEAKWKELNIAPSDKCSDEVFVRRAYLDITGTLPTPDQVKEFQADKRADKRDKLIDKLVDSEEYAYFFANKWSDILRIKRGSQNQQGQARAYGTFAFHNWVREALLKDMRYDQFAREILTAVGDETLTPPVVWHKDFQTPDQFVDNASQVFLGTRIQCAQCHHHPYEKWSQDDYWGLAAYYGRVAKKNIPVRGQNNNQQNQKQVFYVRSTGGNVINKRTNRTAVMKPLDGEPAEVDRDRDPRQQLVDWMVNAKNPFFARAVANRYWAHFFGRGIVDPLDDMRVTNPPSNPELLDALAKELVEHDYSLKHLVKVICKSSTYQLSAEPNESNKHDKQAYARYYPKRMSAEVLFDAVCQVTDSPTAFPGLPQDAHAPKRAIMLPDESFASYFLDVFGRPQRLSACECERVSEANLAQVLHLLNSEEVQGKLARNGGRADVMAKDPRPDGEKVEELFVWAVGHKPTPAKLNLALDHLAKYEKNKRKAYEDILWALLNTKEFYFNE